MDPTTQARPHYSGEGAPGPVIRNSPLIPLGSLITHSCSFCQQRKLKCDMQSPCGQCSKRSLQCFYVERLPGKKRGPKPKKAIDAGIVAKIIPTAQDNTAGGPGLQHLTEEVAKLKAEVASLSSINQAPPQKMFSPDTESFIQQDYACQSILQEFANTIVPVLSWYSLPDPQRLLFCWSSLLRDSGPNISESLRHFYNPDAVSIQLEACSIFTLTCGLMRKPDLAEHFEDLCQAFIQTIFFKREAKLDLPCLRRVGSAIMLLLFRYMTDSKPVATRYIGTFLVEVAGQLEASGAPEDAELLYAIATRAAGLCAESRATPQWLRRVAQQSTGRSLISTIELRFFEIFNQFLASDGNAFIPVETLHQILDQIDVVEHIIHDTEALPEPRTVSNWALNYYRCWFILLRGEVYLRLGRDDLIPELIRLAGTIAIGLPFGLRVALAGLTSFAGQGPHGPGFRIAPVILAILQPLAIQTPVVTSPTLSVPCVADISVPVSPPTEGHSSSETPVSPTYQSPTINIILSSSPHVVDGIDAAHELSFGDDILFSGM